MIDPYGMILDENVLTEEEQEKVNNHYPAALSFSTTPKQEL